MPAGARTFQATRRRGLRKSVVVAMLGVILVGCDGAAAPSVPFSPSLSTTAQAIATLTPAPTSTTQVSATPLPKPSPTPAVPPPPPAGVKITRQGCYTGRDPDGIPPGECTTTISWEKVVTKGTEVQVYGVTGCLSLIERAGEGSCLVRNTAVPPSVRKLIAQAPASSGSVSWTGPAWLDVIQQDTGGPSYQAIGVDRRGDDIFFAIIVAASNEVGHSKFIIADAGTWCYDTGCEGP
jgi:hypothetical protein